jgi:hypothetical protein
MAQLRGGTIGNDTGALVELPLGLPIIEKFLTEPWWKLSFNLHAGHRVRIVKEADGRLLPTIWDDTIQAYRPLLSDEPLPTILLPRDKPVDPESIL